MAELQQKVEIADGWSLLRRVRSDQHVPDGNGGKRPSSAAFRDPNMSVDALELLQRDGQDWDQTLRADPSAGVVTFSAGAARALKQDVVHEPLDQNFAHTEVRGKKNATVARELARVSRWLRQAPTD